MKPSTSYLIGPLAELAIAGLKDLIDCDRFDRLMRSKPHQHPRYYKNWTLEPVGPSSWIPVNHNAKYALPLCFTCGQCIKRIETINIHFPDPGERAYYMEGLYDKHIAQKDYDDEMNVLR